MIPNTVERVPLHTAEEVNDSIRRQTEENIRQFSSEGRATIDKRLVELDAEWDIERTLEANAATAVLTSVLLGAAFHKGFFLFSAVVGGFLLQHAVQGWCPPVPVFRRLGFRTQTEIDQERYALKALRGDFQRVRNKENPSRKTVHRAIDAVRR
jgi:enolase